MNHIQHTVLSDRTHRVQLATATGLATWPVVLDGLLHDASLRASLTSTIRDSPFQAVFWETIPFVPHNPATPFEFVLVDAPPLTRVHADRAPFAEHLDDIAPDAVCTFTNLGGDAVLIAPTAHSWASSHQPCAHLASYLRAADNDECDRFWNAVGHAIAARINGRQRPLWVSTSGLGVYWVHVRLDDRPKYYTHTDYRDRSR